VRHVVLWVEQSRGGRHGIKKDHTTRKHTDLHAAVLPVRAERARILKTQQEDMMCVSCHTT
jgi:hypothetical protein